MKLSMIAAFTLLVSLSAGAFAEEADIEDEGASGRCTPVAYGCPKGGGTGRCTARIPCSELLNPPPGQRMCEVEGQFCLN